MLHIPNHLPKSGLINMIGTPGAKPEFFERLLDFLALLVNILGYARYFILFIVLIIGIMALVLHEKPNARFLFRLMLGSVMLLGMFRIANFLIHLFS